MILTMDNVREVFLSELPEVRKWAESTFGPDYDLDEEASESYLLFEDVVKKLLFKLLEDGTAENLLTSLFRFFERMAISSDGDVVDLLGIAILEPLVFRQESVREAWKHIGPKTRELIIAEAQHHGRLDSLPPGVQTSLHEH